MPNLSIDTGVQEFTVNGRGALRFNPGDPNLYHRFFAAQQPLTALDAELSAALDAIEQEASLTEEARAEAVLAQLTAYDGKIKAMLGELFGPANDFDVILEGVNVAAVGANGRRVVQNLLEALAPVLQQGAERTVQARADAAVQQAEQARRQREAV